MRRWRVAYILWFADNRLPRREKVILHEGTEAECRRIQTEFRMGDLDSVHRLIERVTVVVEAEPEKKPSS